jgi:hypothetical protein
MILVVKADVWSAKRVALVRTRNRHVPVAGVWR